MKVLAVSLIVALLVQKATSVKFHVDRTVYAVQLPDANYKLVRTQYTEGSFERYVFSDSSMVIIHLGSNVAKPFLVGSEYNCTSDVLIHGNQLMKGFIRRNNENVYWCEYTFEGGEATLIYTNVSSDRIATYDAVISSLAVVGKINNQE